jgi:hypothetical protein
MRIGAYFSAIKVEAADAVKYGSANAAVLDAQHSTDDCRHTE